MIQFALCILIDAFPFTHRQIMAVIWRRGVCVPTTQEVCTVCGPYKPGKSHNNLMICQSLRVPKAYLYPVFHIHCWQPQVCSRTAVLLWPHGGPGFDRWLHWREYPRQSPWLGLTPICKAPQSPWVLPLALRRPQLLLLLPVVWQLSLLLQTQTLQWLQDLPSTKSRWENGSGL